MAEALAVIGSVSAVVQLIDFSGKCISKGVELYRSGDGILDENAAIELAANHLTTLRVQVEDRAVRLNDAELQNLCSAIASASSDLSEVLAEVRMQGNKTKWKTLRKAIRSVWSKDKILDLEHRLCSFRSELNLHITLRAKQQLESLGSDIESQFAGTTEAQRRVIDAIIQNRDIFATTLQDQTNTIRTISEEIKGDIESSHDMTRTEFRQIVADSKAANHNEHNQTRQEIRIEVERVETRNQESISATAQKIESIEVEIVNVVNTSSEVNQAEHRQTQSQIAELRQALQELTDQLALRNEELREVVVAFQATKNKKSKKQLSDRSKVLTAAIIALETMYRSLKRILIALQDRTKELLENIESSELWTITRYAHRMASSSSTHDFSQRDLTELSALEETSPNPQSNSYSAHDVYFSYFYSGVTEHSNVIDANAMEDRWKFHPECNSVSKPHLEGFVVDETPCSSGYLWLLASLALTLETHLTPQDAVFAVLSEVFDLSTLKNSNTFTHGPLTPRLKSDVNYWISFAKSRRMQDAMSQETFDYHLLHGHPKEDLINLLILLLTNTNSHRKPHEGLSLTLRAEGGPTRTIVRSLRDVGLPFAMPVSESIMMHELDSNIIEFGTPRLIFSCAEDLGTYQRSLLD